MLHGIWHQFTGAAAGLAVCLAPLAAQAGTANDTLVFAVPDPISVIDTIYDPKPTNNLLAGDINATLLYYDPRERVFKGEVAESWRQVDPVTYEFKIKKGGKFHDGSELDADDVVYSLNFFVDPAHQFRLKTRFDFMARAEKVDSHTVRVITKGATVESLMRIARACPILPSDAHAKLADKNKWGLAPIGAGPYKVASVDQNKGAILVRNPDYSFAADHTPHSKIGRIHVRPIPDAQTQIAELMTGGIDAIYLPASDQIDALTRDPRFTVTAKAGQTFSYIAFDAVDRSGRPELKDKRVRTAIAQAIDSERIRKSLIASGTKFPRPDAMCFDHQRGCAYSTKPPSYDPARARELLKEAGISGLKLEIVAPTFPMIAEGVAGNLRAIGIQASVRNVNFGAYRQLQGQGKINLLVHMWDAAGTPDIASTTSFFFGGHPRDYWADAEINAWAKAAGEEFDDDKRKALARQLFDKVNREVYIIPIARVPEVWLHIKDLDLGDRDETESMGFRLRHLRWK